MKAMLLVPALVLLVGLINAEKTGKPMRILAFKTPLSTLFIVAWFIEPAQNPTVAVLILVALVFCLSGDILLAIGSSRAFLGGLVSFLLGHVVYAAAFFMVGRVGPVMAAGVLGLFAAAAVIWRWLEPHLGRMTSPVLAYIVIISVMLCGALGVLNNSALPAATRVNIIAGAVFFYISDLFVARQRFVIDAHMNRVLGLPLYYTAQFLLAFSAAGIPG